MLGHVVASVPGSQTDLITCSINTHCSRGNLVFVHIIIIITVAAYIMCHVMSVCQLLVYSLLLIELELVIL